MWFFCPGHVSLDQLYNLHRVLEVSWEFAQPGHMCFVDLAFKSHLNMSLAVLYGRCFGGMGLVQGPVQLEQELGPHCQQYIAAVGPVPGACWTLALCDWFCSFFLNF